MQTLFDNKIQVITSREITIVKLEKIYKENGVLTSDEE